MTRETGAKEGTDATSATEERKRGKTGGGFVRRRWAAIGAAVARGRAWLARPFASGSPLVVAGFGAGAVLAVLALIVAGVALFGQGDEAARPRRSVAAGVPLPATLDRPQASVDAPDAVANGTAQAGGGLGVPAATAEAFSHIPPVRGLTALPEDPDPALLETAGGGLALPRIGADGRLPWRTYARPFDRSDDRPRIVIVIAGLGLGGAATNAAVERMPGEVALAFDPVAGDLTDHVRRARSFGHETLAMLPLESANFPFEDPGAATLRAEAEDAENLQRLHRVLAAAPASVGVLAIGGTRFARSERAVRPILRALAARGLLLADASGEGAALLAAEAAGLDVPRVLIDTVIDDEVDAASIDARLAELEAQARRSHVAVGLARPLPVSLGRIRAWLETLAEKGLALAPLSAVVGTQVRTDLGAGR